MSLQISPAKPVTVAGDANPHLSVRGRITLPAFRVNLSLISQHSSRSPICIEKGKGGEGREGKGRGVNGREGMERESGRKEGKGERDCRG